MNKITLEEVEAYEEMVTQLAELKKQEMTTRKDLAKRVREHAIKVNKVAEDEKVFEYEGEGFTLKFKPVVNITLDQDSIDENYEDMTEEEQECIEQKWSLCKSEYKKLRENIDNEDYKGDRDLLIFEAITEKPGAPDLTIDIQ